MSLLMLQSRFAAWFRSEGVRVPGGFGVRAFFRGLKSRERAWCQSFFRGLKSREKSSDTKPSCRGFSRAIGQRENALTLGPLGECRELVANEIGGRAVELRDKLKYHPDQVKAVMTKALAVYLDERISVSSRRHFGLL